MVVQHNLRYAFRGPELGFAIPWGDFAALEEVAALACDFWNGANSLVIAVGDGGELPDLDVLLEICDIERVYVHDNVDGTGRVALDKRFGNRLTSPWAYRLDREQHPLNLQPSFGAGGMASPPPVLPLPIYDNELLQRLTRIAFGRIKEEDRGAYETAFRLESCVGPSAHFALVDGQVSGLAPLAQSTKLIYAYEQISPLDVRQLLVLDSNDFQGLINFWNLRARTARDGGASVVAVPVQALAASDQLASLRDWTSGPGTVKPDVFVLTGHDERDAAASALEAVGYTAAPSGVAEFTVYIGHVPSDREAAEYSLTDRFRLGGHMHRGAPADQLVSLEKGQKNTVRLETRHVMTANAGGTVTLDLVSWPLPFRPTEVTARRVHRDASVHDGMVCLRTVAMNNPYLFDLVLPGDDDALTDFLAVRGLEQEPSPAGRYAQALVRRLGGPQRLESLANGLALKVLTPLTPPSRKKLVQRLEKMLNETYGAGNAPSHEEILEATRAHMIALELPHPELQGLASAAGADEPTVLDTLEPLVETGFVLRGRTERCPECGYEAFHSLNEIAEQLTCHACQLQFLLPVKCSTDRGSQEPPLTYQLDPLMARAMDQDLLPVLLTLRYLSTPQGSSISGAFWPGLEIFEPGQREETKRDCDILLAQNGRVTVCECKKTAWNLSAKQAGQVTELAERLDADVVFAAVEGDFPPEVVEEVAGPRVRFVGGMQLVPESAP